jgi:hypothetical protein
MAANHHAGDTGHVTDHNALEDLLNSHTHAVGYAQLPADLRVVFGVPTPGQWGPRPTARQDIVCRYICKKSDSAPFPPLTGTSPAVTTVDRLTIIQDV